MTTPINAHALIVGRAPMATPTIYTDIAELSQVALPELSRNEFDSSVQNRNVDSYVLGMLRRKSVMLTLNFLPADPTHDHMTGLYSAIIANSIDGYKFYQTFSGLIWVASGQVQAIVPKTPTDGKLEADVTIRFSGVMSIGSPTGTVTIGT
jgi:hypothetical protein